MIAASIGEISALYERWGDEHYDEDLSQLAHALQTAALAARSGASDELVVAALCHDVGHLLDLIDALPGSPRPHPAERGHEAQGARYLAGVFGPAVTAPVALHVQAKRYLCATDPAYLGGLSSGSRHSLEGQGGPMSTLEERLKFEQHPSFGAAVRLRTWDDRAKVVGTGDGSFDRHVPRLQRVAAREGRVPAG